MQHDSIRLCRSQLAVPANNLSAIEDATETAADQVFFDLEDSLHTSEKVEARQTLIEAIEMYDWGEKTLNYRINRPSTRWWYDDIIQVVEEVGDKIEGVILPKVEQRSEIRTIEALLEQVEVNEGHEPGRISLAIQIENATGMGNVEQIVKADTSRLAAVIFGPGDYSISIEAKGQVMDQDTDYQGHYWHYPLSRISHAAASQDLLAIDGLYTDVDDVDGFRQSCKYAKMLGYDGKWVIHSDQTDVANEIFSPSYEEAKKAKQIVDIYRNSDQIPMIEGRIIDERTLNMARHIVAKARESGVLE